MSDPLRVAAQRLFDAALDSGFPPEEIDPESSYAQRVTLRGRDLDDLRAALAAAPARPEQRTCRHHPDGCYDLTADTARPGLDVEAMAEALDVCLPEDWNQRPPGNRTRAKAIAREYDAIAAARLTEDRP